MLAPMKPDTPPQSPTPRVESPAATFPRAVLDSSALLSGRDRVAIRHGAETYQLRLTRQGKLILTK